MTPSLDRSRCGKVRELSRNLVFSWFLVCVGFVACFVGSFWWIQGAALTAFAFTRWPVRLLKAEQEVSREASLIHQAVVGFGCLLVMALAIVEVTCGRHAPMFDAVWKSGAGMMLCAQLIGDVLLAKEIRKLKP